MLLYSLQQLWIFILELNNSVANKKVSVVSEVAASEGIKTILALLDTLYAWAEEIEPVQAASRFGNRAFRTWHERLVEQAGTVLQPVIAVRNKNSRSDEHDFNNKPAELVLSDNEAQEEIGAYLCRSFGDEVRIDYGSGHEAMFTVVLYCLRQIGVFNDKDSPGLVLLVFRRYLKVTRKLQQLYMLEPAGSHGVWGLDDYSFLPFLWGSAQLLASQRISPTIVMDDVALAEHRNEYLYVDAIAFIKEIKKGPFFEHSPMLYDISQVRGGWPKINQGMIRMYRGEVWEKRVVIQHFLFGKIFRFEHTQKTQSSGKGTTPAPSV